MAILNFFILILSTAFFKAYMVICQNRTYHENDLIALNGFQKCIVHKIEGWDSPRGECCSWRGITCDNSSVIRSRVIAVDLGNRGLDGEVCQALAGLDHLRFLNVSHNYLPGYIPASLFHMRQMEVLDLSYNGFVGQFPVNTSQPVLRSLDLSDNRLNGLLIKTICSSSPKIESINLAYNYFSGEIPANLGNCTSLLHLSLSGNNLSGRLPDSFYRLQSLNELYLQENSFTGTLDDKFSNMSSIVSLDISNNAFSGFLPNAFERFARLEHFSAHSNRFLGQLPVSLVNSPSMLKLDLYNNSLTGPININCSAMLNLSYLYLSSNGFDGPIPENLSTCQSLKILDPNHGNFTGGLPIWFQNLQSLEVLSLSNTSLSNLPVTLDVLRDCQNLTILVLSTNFLHEEMPNDINIMLRKLKTLVMRNCKLTGSIPSWLSGSINLQQLDLSGNKLSGKIPNWIGEFNSLFYLNLLKNSLCGELPESLTKLQSLVHFNIALMQDPLTSFPLSYSSGLGRRSSYEISLASIPAMDLSENQLNGSIWAGFGDLADLHVLSLSSNNNSGTIPGNLSGMVNLKFLDLSHNFLSGEIPRSLGNLTSLSSFDVSYNNLSGEIPSRGQLATFSISSYQGNKHLCGKLLAPCISRTENPADNEPASENTGHLISIDEAVLPFSIGAGVGFIMTIVCCFMSGWVFAKGKKIRR